MNTMAVFVRVTDAFAAQYDSARRRRANSILAMSYDLSNRTRPSCSSCLRVNGRHPPHGRSQMTARTTSTEWSLLPQIAGAARKGDRRRAGQRAAHEVREVDEPDGLA